MPVRKREILGVLVDEVTPSDAVERVIDAAKDKHLYRTSALAVHGVMEAHDDPVHLQRINQFEMVTPDGQPVRWALNFLYRSRLRERVYGPRLMLDVCERAAQENLSVFLLGTDEEILRDLEKGLIERFPGLRVAGAAPSTFGRVDEEQFEKICDNITSSGADITFVGLGCPRQEIFTFEAGHHLKMPILAVGAAFEYHAGHREEPPAWIQRYGLQWLHRLLSDPKRLWKRYLTTNPRFVLGVLTQRLGGTTPKPFDGDPPFIGWA